MLIHLFNSRPISHLLISFVPAPISYNLASLKNLPVGYSFMYPLPPKHYIASKATYVAFDDVNNITAAQSFFD